MNRVPSLRLLTAAALAAVVGACSGDSPTPTDLTERMPEARTFAAPSGLTLPTGTESWLYVCKLANNALPANGGVDDGTVGRTFHFDVSAGGGTIVAEASDPAGVPIVAYGTSVALSDDCWLVWAGDEDEDVTVTERLDATIELVSTQLENSEGSLGSNDTNRLTPGASDGEWIVTPVAGFNIVYFKNRTLEVQEEPLTVEKTAVASYDRTHRWSLEKTVNPGSHSGLPGDEFQSIWTVTATKVTVEDNYQVTGFITVSNSNDFAVPFTLTDVLDDGTGATITCPGTNDNTGTVPANGSVQCSYTASPTDATATENTVTVTSDVGGDSDTEGFTWTVNVFGDDEVTLSDPRVLYTNDISVSTTELFPEDFVCPTDLTLYVNGVWTETYVNTAYLDGDNTDLEDSAEVRVTCRVPDFEGCTPGYWRQEQHFGNWVGFATDDLFADVFSVPYGGTLLEAVWARGGGANALARHAVAALLNTANDGVTYPYSTAQVIAAVQAAFASGDYETAKNMFEAANELGCDLGRAELPGAEDQGPRGRRGGN